MLGNTLTLKELQRLEKLKSIKFNKLTNNEESELNKLFTKFGYIVIRD